MKDAFSYEPEVVVEEYIEGREFSVGVVDEGCLPDHRDYTDRRLAITRTNNTSQAC